MEHFSHVLVFAGVTGPQPGTTNSATREAECLGLVAAAKKECRTHTARVCPRSRPVQPRPRPPGYRDPHLDVVRRPLSYHVEVTDAGSLRVGHEERERLVHVLMQQYAEGRLTASELDDLSGRARRPGTYADLDRLVADLPVPPPSAGVRQLATTASLARLGTDPEHRQTMTGGMSVRPARDLDRARIPEPQRRDVDGEAGLPAGHLPARGRGHLGLRGRRRRRPRGARGLGVNTDQIGKGIGSVSNKVDTIPHPGKPLLILHGELGGRCGEGPVPKPS